MVHHQRPKTGAAVTKIPAYARTMPESRNPASATVAKKLFIYDVIIYLRRLIKESWVWSSTARAGESQTLGAGAWRRRRRVGFLFESTSIPKFFPLIWNSVQTTTVVFPEDCGEVLFSAWRHHSETARNRNWPIQLRTTDHERKVSLSRACRVSNRLHFHADYLCAYVLGVAAPAWSVSWHLAHNLSA